VQHELRNCKFFAGFIGDSYGDCMLQYAQSFSFTEEVSHSAHIRRRQCSGHGIQPHTKQCRRMAHVRMGVRSSLNRGRRRCTQSSFRYSRRPSSVPTEEVDPLGRQGLLNRVLNSGLLLREGYTTPEAGVWFILKHPICFHAEQGLSLSLTTSSLLSSGCTDQLTRRLARCSRSHSPVPDSTSLSMFLFAHL
jgi:hypothetical protein